ncbi:hypothetical protein LX15_001417 [Streptoalloteichus tenebrarius]|uniref:Transposase n=1 Tax=Streptoalloteichus tenebrarius (strain ATCC 17920 / DSM 40477 / JCM 4838 / CBS 697.72 / NBRC 16177 / NCIMB 11028 / NRRL B-12390 / A12253. 1 / ISP 5477) TaxID=1933 RepID=A0ABT1HQD9_STRSD|nr:hypothetical protein [Streptoalloteichus tenebrarius]
MAIRDHEPGLLADRPGLPITADKARVSRDLGRSSPNAAPG